MDPALLFFGVKSEVTNEGADSEGLRMILAYKVYVRQFVVIFCIHFVKVRSLSKG
jgi:hypothetical protein